MSSSADLLAQFVSVLSREFVPEHPETIWSLEDGLRLIARDGVATTALNRELAKIRADLAYAGDWRRDRVVLYKGTGISLSVWLLDETSPYIHTTSYLGMSIPLGTEPLRFESYRLPARYENPIFDPTLKLEPLGPAQIEPGEVLKLRADGYVYDFRVRRPQLVLQLKTAPVQALEWLFSRDSLLSWQANDSSLTSSQLRVAAYVLGKFAHHSSLAPLSELTAHPHHSVRWAAIQALGRISRSAAVEKLTAAVNDSHPHVRRAATKILQQLQQSKSR